MNIHINKEFLINTLAEMVKINSVNPGLSPDGPGEKDIADFFSNKMQEIGLEADTFEITPKHWNAVGKFKGKGNGKSLMLTGHMDTVGIGNMEKPFSPNIVEGKMFGRGTFDMKCGLAAILAAVKAVKDQNIELAGDLFVAGAADEEYLSKGSEQLAKNYKVDGVIVAEPSGLRPVIAHKGFVWFEITVFGRAAHGSNYQNGIDAIAKMGRFLTEFEKLAQEQQNSEPYPLLGPPSVHASLINGGVEMSTYPPVCTVKLEWRTIPGQNKDDLEAKLVSIIKSIQESDPDFHAEIQTIFERPPFQVSQDAPIVKSVLSNTQLVTGKSPEFMGMAGWADTSLFEQAGMDALIFGPSGEGAHSEVEWVDIESVVTTAEIFAKVILDFCS